MRGRTHVVGRKRHAENIAYDHDGFDPKGRAAELGLFVQFECRRSLWWRIMWGRRIEPSSTTAALLAG
jgi:hypothetical protein